MHETWRHSGGAGTFTCGYSCQPFSRLGDGRSSADARASSLTKALRMAYYLQAQVVILECVAPAAQDAWVKGEIEHFLKHTGFHCSQTELKLDDVWPCRRHRAWWVLSSPKIGPVDIHTWPIFTDVHEVCQVIPSIRLWAAEDEKQLALDETEMQAFGVSDNQHAKYLLNGKSKAPCALHAWGSQTRPCPCGCRHAGFSQSRLESKGLHGCITRSADHEDGTSTLRHLHPNEAMALNSFDPIVDFGHDVRLTLSAVGQLACPVQALWILGSVMERLDTMKHEKTFTRIEQIQAYRSWLMMRCRQVWPIQHENITDNKMLSLVAFWNNFRDLSLSELLFPMRWEGQIDGTVSIASILDHLIRTQEVVAPTIPDADRDMHSMPEDLAETPVMDEPRIVDDPTLAGCLCVDSCTVIFADSAETPVRFHPKCGSTLAQFLHAHEKLVGKFEVDCIKIGERVISSDHVMEVAQVIVIHVKRNGLDHPMPACEPAVSPTAEWTHPAADLTHVRSPPRKVSKFDVGECVIPNEILPDDHSWLDARPLHGLQGNQFLKLQMPGMQNAQQLWSLRHQYLRSEDRLVVLNQQERFWADDEIRFHLHAVVLASQEHQIRLGKPAAPVCVIDPLISSAWLQQRGFDCKLWADDHPEIKNDGIPVITVVLIGQHWVPLFMSPIQHVLHVHTWDGMGAVHDGLDEMVTQLAHALGFASAMVSREHRLFFTSDLCGALAIAFLRHAIVGTQLPTDCTEATVIHARLKDRYAAELQRCQIARRPWIWGAGDNPGSSHDPGPCSSDLHLAVNITRDQRIDLINQKGFAMGDDEVRYHVMQLVSHQTDSHKQPMDRKFIFMEPLIFNCWDSIGHVIAKQWCSRNTQIKDNCQNIVTAVAVENHWLPLWFVPQGEVMQVHTFHAEGSFDAIDTVIAALTTNLGFQEHAVHRIPTGLPEHMMCGAHALAFIAHVTVGMPLPENLGDLRTLHTNMRASFVAHLYSLEYTPKPVVWGNGTPRESGPLPIMPEEEHHDVSSLRSQRSHMLSSHGYAMGDDEIHFHVQHLLECRDQGPRDVGTVRRFMTVSPKVLHDWLQGDTRAFHTWLVNDWRPALPNVHLVVVVLLQQHWVPIWIAPAGNVAQCHTLIDFAPDDNELATVIHQLARGLGYTEVMIHKVPHGLEIERLSGTMSIIFLAHILVRTRLPSDVHQLRSRCWDMKMVFAKALEQTQPTFPDLWGWGHIGESRLLPKLPGVGPFVAAVANVSGTLNDAVIPGPFTLEDCDTGFTGMGHHEMLFHIGKLNEASAPKLKFMVAIGIAQLYEILAMISQRGTGCWCFALLHNAHWTPVVAVNEANEVGVGTLIVEDDVAFPKHGVFMKFHRIVVPVCTQVHCGAITWLTLASLRGLSMKFDGLHELRKLLAAQFADSDPPTRPGPTCWGFGPQGQLVKNLAAELLKHGIPEQVADDRAAQAIKVLGSEQVMTALNHRNPWKQLKLLGNNSKFQFVMPSELARVVDANHGRAVTGKGKSKGAKQPPQPVELGYFSLTGKCIAPIEHEADWTS